MSINYLVGATKLLLKLNVHIRYLYYFINFTNKEKSKIILILKDKYSFVKKISVK